MATLCCLNKDARTHRYTLQLVERAACVVWIGRALLDGLDFGSDDRLLSTIQRAILRVCWAVVLNICPDHGCGRACMARLLGDPMPPVPQGATLGFETTVDGLSWLPALQRRSFIYKHTQFEHNCDSLVPIVNGNTVRIAVGVSQSSGF